MARRVVLHVGTMKSGTSFLQALLFAQQELLEARDVLVPGTGWNDQVTAVQQALSRKGPRPVWKSMSQQIANHRGDAVISMEFLGPALDPAAERVLEPFEGTEVQVVVTARDLNRTLVSMWQETIQNGRSWTWEDYYAGARDAAPGTDRGHADRKTAAGTFWRQQHLLRIVADWAARVGKDNVTLVTLPHPGAPSSALTERFIDATGFPIDPTLPVPRANESLGLASAMVLRELNEALDARGLAFPIGQRLRKQVVAKTALAALAKSEPRLGLEVADWVRTQTDQTVAAVRDLGIRVVGDLADLDPVDVPGATPADVDAETRLRAATTALTAAVADRLT
ncbi:hypothetical protein [Nocardioides panacisoli]|uniref:Sulfotransferase family protein n=1 Tax=Nocardioides panacisoli TaxID=627624 RepID=A0ABP7IT61_9ACTN